MSRREKRLIKKLKHLSVDYEKKEVLGAIVAVANETLKQANEELDELWNNYKDMMEYIYKNEDADISYDLLELPDGRQINVMILQANDTIAVSYNGLIGKAKRHECDEFQFEVGYNIAAARLILAIMESEYGF